MMQKWLTRLRKDLSRSGSLTELSMHLAKRSSTDVPTWQQNIRRILEGEMHASTDFVLAVDSWVAQRSQKSNDKNGEQLDLL